MNPSERAEPKHGGRRSVAHADYSAQNDRLPAAQRHGAEHRARVHAGIAQNLDQQIERAVEHPGVVFEGGFGVDEALHAGNLLHAPERAEFVAQHEQQFQRRLACERNRTAIDRSSLRQGRTGRARARSLRRHGVSAQREPHANRGQPGSSASARHPARPHGITAVVSADAAWHRHRHVVRRDAGTGPTITTFVAYALKQKPRAPAFCLITR